MIELLIGFGWIALYFACAATIALLCRLFIKIPDEVFRKILHTIMLFSMTIWMIVFQTWWIAVIAAVSFAVIVFPILLLLEKRKNYSEMVTERKKGELKSSLLVVFGMFAVVMCICWGWLGDKYLVLASVYAWGFGDALAALIGKRYGKHKISWKGTDGKKSYEGSLSMLITSLVTVLTILLVRGGLSIAGYIIIPVATALICTLVELYTKDGFDTITCPFSAMATLLPLVYLFGGLV